MPDIALVLYDTFLTFDAEVALIWKRKWSITTALYLLGRYPFIIGWNSRLLFMMLPSVTPLMFVAFPYGCKAGRHLLTFVFVNRCDVLFKLNAAMVLITSAANIGTILEFWLIRPRLIRCSAADTARVCYIQMVETSDCAI